MPLTRIVALLEVGPRTRPGKIVVSARSVTGAGKPGASNVSVSVPLEMTRPDARRLPGRRRLMPRDDLLDGQPSRRGHLDVGREAIGRGVRDADQGVAGPELEALGSRRWLDRHRHPLRRHERRSATRSSVSD